MKRRLAHCLLYIARRCISAANQLNPPKQIWIDGNGKRWEFQGPPRGAKGVLAFRNDIAIYTGGPTGRAMQRYLDELESQGWN